jgi:restriction system protein
VWSVCYDEDKDTGTAAPREVSQEQEWKEKLYAILTQKLTPAAFERLVQRLLRESGFTHVEVTGRSGDGGIDGRGIARVHGLLSFHVLFQCKRYKGAVGPGEIRDFRGAMTGRADKGLFITTGTFTPAAVKEATRDGAPPIDLLDGAEVVEKLRELSLGVLIEKIEVVRVEEQCSIVCEDGDRETLCSNERRFPLKSSLGSRVFDRLVAN